MSAEEPGFTDSIVSSCYENELPSLPRGLKLQLESSSWRKKRPNKSGLRQSNHASPISSNRIPSSSSDIALSTIVELNDRDSSPEDNKDAFTESSNDETTPIYANHRVLGYPRGLEEGREGEDQQRYIPLKRTQPDHQHYNIPSQKTRYHPPSPSPTPSPGQTGYIKVNSRDGRVPSPTATQSVPWNLRETLHRRYLEMRKVGMDGTFCMSHSGAKKFFTVLVVTIVLLLVALTAMVVATTSWTLLNQEADMIETNVRRLKSCRVGSNWTSVTINGASDPVDISIPVNGSHVRILLDDIPTNIVNHTNISSLNARQILVYVILRRKAVRRPPPSEGSASLDNIILVEEDNSEKDSEAFINVALWTRKEKGSSFREYMPILNAASSPQISSRSFWLPLDNHTPYLFVSAHLIDGRKEESPMDLDFRLYLAGYC